MNRERKGIRPYLSAYLAVVVTFLVIDAIWLFTMTSRFYAPQLGELLRPDPNLTIAAVFYLLYAMAVVVLASAPAALSGSTGRSLFLGAVLGLAAYGTYDITNLATIKGWPPIVAVVDILWGMSLTAICGLAGCLAFGRRR